jgi:hypothetical protein
MFPVFQNRRLRAGSDLKKEAKPSAYPLSSFSSGITRFHLSVALLEQRLLKQGVDSRMCAAKLPASPECEKWTNLDADEETLPIESQKED